MLDLAIIGSGPAALSAAIYAARAGLSVTIYERGKIGGTLPDIAHVANYPAYDGSGQELADKMRAQAEDLGVKIEYAEYGEEEIAESKAILFATGSEPRPLDFKPDAPVSYCALCDAPLYNGKNLLVIGGGNSAIGESLMLADLAASVTIMSHSPLKAEQSRIDQLKNKPNVRIIENTEPTPENTKGYDGIFVYIGKRPAAAFLPKEYLDEAGYIVTEPDTHHIKDNLFAAGDVRSGTLKQIVIAAADGAAAAVEIIDFCHKLEGHNAQ